MDDSKKPIENEKKNDYKKGDKNNKGGIGSWSHIHYPSTPAHSRSLLSGSKGSLRILSLRFPIGVRGHNILNSLLSFH